MMQVILILLIVGVVVGLAWLLREQQSPKRHRPVEKTSPRPDVPDHGTNLKALELEKLRQNKLFWGVEVKHAGCSMARTLADVQFEFDDAPTLPLEGCTAPMCSCVYIGLKERRNYQRRQHDRRGSLRFDPDKSDRRSLKDRRRGEKWRGHDL